MKKITFIILLLLPAFNVSAQFGHVDTSRTIVDTLAVKTDTVNVDTTVIIEEDSATVARRDSAAKEIIYNGTEFAPEFPGGGPAMNYFLEKNLMYPPKAKAEGIQGKVFVKFVVDKNGVIKHAHIYQGLGGGCDEEALRLVKRMPKWQPGYRLDVRVHSWVVLPIPFVLPKK